MKTRKLTTQSFKLLLAMAGIFIFYLLLNPKTYAEEPAEIELQGEFIITFNNCGCPEHEATGPELIYFLQDHTNNKTIELDIGPEQAKKVKVDKLVILRGNFIEKKDRGHYGAKGKLFKPSKINYEAEPLAPQARGDLAKDGPLADGSAEAGAVTQDLQCLIIHANSMNNPVNASKIQSMENMVFNATDNISKAVLAATYGHYRLTHGNVKSITVELPTVVANQTQYGTMSNLMVAALPDAFSAIGETFDAGDYDRYLICTPNGTLGIPTAWGSFGGSPRRTMYGYGWTGTTFDGILHELGHNFGFRHSGTGTNQYGDRTCVMGYSHLGRGHNTATYNVVKKLQAGWFAPFPNTETTISGDATFDLYPISQDPDATPGMRCVKVNDSAHYISYRRKFSPYAWLRYNSDRDKVYVHRSTSFFSTSWREQGLTSGSYTAGTTQVIFERYGPNKEYATVSFDMVDGNTKPVANSGAHTVQFNTPYAITLTGSDLDGDILTYEKVTDPSQGILSGNAPNLIYTPNANYTGADSFVFKVDDGKISSFATINITVNPLPAIYAGWVDSFGDSFDENGISGNPDSDNSSNLQEFASGTNPTISDGGPLEANGTRNGEPIIKEVTPNSFAFYFMRRDDYGTPGSVNYTVQFSSDMITFYDSDVAPELVIDSTDDTAYHVARVAYPATLPNGSTAKFGRLQMTIAP